MKPTLVAALALLVGACGGDDGSPTSLEDTCTAVREAFPANLYDAETTRAFADEMAQIDARADEESRRAFADFQRRLDAVGAAGTDNEAFIDANLELLRTLEKVNADCLGAGAERVRP